MKVSGTGSIYFQIVDRWRIIKVAIELVWRKVCSGSGSRVCHGYGDLDAACFFYCRWNRSGIHHLRGREDPKWQDGGMSASGALQGAFLPDR